jgi:hypothetical protein
MSNRRSELARIATLLPAFPLLVALCMMLMLPSVESAAADTAPPRLLISIDKAAQLMTVSVDGVARYSWPVSTGMAGRETPNGTFQPFRMEEQHFSKEWDDAPMPHSIFFTQVGHAIHGSDAVARLGTPVSHGCVRISPENASKLFGLVEAEGLLNTRVVITGAEPDAAEQHVAKLAPPHGDAFLQEETGGNAEPSSVLPGQATGKRSGPAESRGEAELEPQARVAPPVYSDQRWLGDDEESADSFDDRWDDWRYRRQLPNWRRHAYRIYPFRDERALNELPLDDSIPNPGWN